MRSIDARMLSEPSPFPLAGYVLGSLLSLAAATLASGSTFTLTIAIAASKDTQLSGGSILLLGLAPLLIVMSLVLARSTRRHGYSMSGIGAGVLIAVIWPCAMVAALLVSFGDPFAASGVDSRIVVGAERLAQSVLWMYVTVLTVNIGCSPLLGRTDRLGRIARIVFLSTTGALGLLAIIPAAGNLILTSA